MLTFVPLHIYSNDLLLIFLLFFFFLPHVIANIVWGPRKSCISVILFFVSHDAQQAARMGLFPVCALFGGLESKSFQVIVDEWKPMNTAKTIEESPQDAITSSIQNWWFSFADA